jgi:hypothetical protein
VTNNNGETTPCSQPSHSPQETSANRETTDSEPNGSRQSVHIPHREERNIEERRNGPNQESGMSKEPAESSKQCTTFGVSDSVTNTSSKERESDNIVNEPQHRTSNRPKKNPSSRNGDFLWT